MNHHRSYENLLPDWRSKDIIVFEEDVEEKIDDFPEFTDGQRQLIRNAMHGNPHSVSKKSMRRKCLMFGDLF